MCVSQIREWLETKNAAEGKSPLPTIPSSISGEILPAKPPSDLARWVASIRERIGKDPTIQEMSYYGRPVADSEVEEAKRLGVVVAELAKPEGEKPASDGFQLRRDQGPRVNDLEPNRVYAFDFTANGKCELAWSLMGGGGGYIDTWINRDGQMVPDTFQRVIMGPAGQTYFSGMGTYRFCIRHDHSQPVRLGVQIV